MEIREFGVPVINIRLVDGGRIGGLITVENPADAVKVIAHELSDQVREVIYVLNIDARGHVLSVYQAALGTTDRTMITGKEVYQAALLSNAVAVILIHNHPGQDPTPSSADIFFTKTMRYLGTTLGVELADHIIVAGGDPEKIVSFRENHFFEGRKTYEENQNTCKRNRRSSRNRTTHGNSV